MGHVVIADGASVRDPEDGAKRREEMHHLFLTRGQPVPEGITDKALQSLIDQGAVAEDDSEEARLALAGMPRSTSLRRNPGVMNLQNEAEAIRAAQSAAQFPGGLSATGAEQSEADLLKLPMTSLVVFCKAFGIEVDEKADKAKLAKLLANGGKDPEDAGDRETLRTERDQRQISAIESAPGDGIVESELTGDSRSGGRSRSKSSSSNKTSQATKTSQSEPSAEQGSTRSEPTRS